ncbi:hypothetical protein FBU31_001707 [Coemansia sp. 'formosensis']|nr:hypothetical protein FBU31_001707 [Coemansia sp. 'formosensis']
MKFKLSVSALIVAVATCTGATKSEHGDDAVHKRGLVIGDQPPLIAEETPANTADVVVANDSAAVVPAAAGAQPPTMLFDSSFANLRNAPMGYVQVQQAPAAQQLMLTAAAPGLSPAGFQHFVDAPQIFIQAQPAISSVAPITIIQAMSPASMIMPPFASLAVAVPATPTTSAVAADKVASTMSIVPATSASTASAATSVAVSVAAPVSTSAPVAVASAAPVAAAPIAAAPPAPVAPAVAPVSPAVAPVGPAAAPAPAAYQVPAPGYAPAAPAAPPSLSDLLLVQQPALAGIADPPAAPVYAQQQLYPVAAAPIAPPALQPGLSALLAKEAAAYSGPLGAAALAAAAAAAANTLPTTVVSGANIAGSQAVVPIDQSLADLLTQSLVAAAGQKSGAAALARASALAGADDDTADAGQSAAADDAAEEFLTSRRREKTAGKSAKARANVRKTKQSAIVTPDADANANVDLDADAIASAAVEAAATVTADDGSDSASADDVASTSIAHKRKGSIKSVSAGAKKGSARSTMDDLDTLLASALNYQTGAAVDANETTSFDDASAIDSATDASYVRPPGSRQRDIVGNIKEEASKAKAEASAEAREAVLAEIRADASAEAAFQASAELHLSPKSVVHDEAASMERESSALQSMQQSRGNYADETALSKAADTDAFYTPLSERTATAEGDRSGIWDAPRVASGVGGRSAYDDEPHSPLYHAYEQTGSESYDRYSRDQMSYSDIAKDSSIGGDWKIHYNGGSPTMYTSGEEPSYTTYYNTDSHSYCADNYNLHYPEERQSGNEHGYDVSTSKPYYFMNKHADSAFARDAASVNNWATSAVDEHQYAATNAPHAVNDLDPLSYATQVCSFRNTLPLVASPDYTPFSAHPSIMVIGVPQTATSTVSVISTAPVPVTSTVMMTKLVTPAVKVVYASDD